MALVCSGGAMNTDMSAFMGLSPNNNLKNGVVSVHGVTYDLYYVIMNTAMMTMNTDHVDYEH